MVLVKGTVVCLVDGRMFATAACCFNSQGFFFLPPEISPLCIQNWLSAFRFFSDVMNGRLKRSRSPAHMHRDKQERVLACVAAVGLGLLTPLRYSHHVLPGEQQMSATSAGLCHIEGGTTYSSSVGWSSALRSSSSSELIQH